MNKTSQAAKPAQSPFHDLQQHVVETLQLAAQHSSAGRGNDALRLIDEALAILPEDGQALLQRFQTLHRFGRFEEAMACLWKVLGSGTGVASVGQEAGSVLFNTNRLAEARSVVDVLLRQSPENGRAWGLLGEILSKQGKEVAGETCFRRNLRVAPGDPVVKIRLGNWLMQLAKYDEAITLFTDALRLAPDNLDAMSGAAQTMISQGRLDEAEPLLQQVIARNSEHLDARLGIARLLLLKGDLAAGWPAYEWRRRRSDLKLPKLAGPEWDGSPLCGKTIVVYAEQGFGDVIQFLRYIPLLFDEGARVILLIPKELEQLCQCLTTYADVVSNLRALPAYDFHIPMLSIPRFLGVKIDSIPSAVPYLQVEPSAKHKLPIPLGTRLKVGLAWAGRPTHANDRHRSTSLETLLPLAAVPGVTLYALQAGPRAADIHKQAHPALVGDLSPHLKDFVDTARVIEQLDLVITVDTSMAHLAGALGKPVWVLIPYAPDWRWLIDGEHSRWYPTMRLFRQGPSCEWEDVIDDVAAELAALAAKSPEFGTEGHCQVNATFPDRNGLPRYRMPIPRSFLPDPGINYLVERERAGIGYEFATRSFLDAHLMPGDLFIDVGAHWGIMSLHAATRWPGQITVLACEGAPRNQVNLQRWVTENDLGGSIEIIRSAIADRTGRGEMRPQSTMGHSLEMAENGSVEVTTIDDLLAARPHLANCRVIVKIDVEGSEDQVIAGMAKLLASGRVAALIWERGRTHDEAAVARIRRCLAQFGFSAWRFESEDKAGALIPFVDDGRVDNVFELSLNTERLPSYGKDRANLAQPADQKLDAQEQARRFFQNGMAAQGAGNVDKALSAYASAATLDRRNPHLYNNLGVALQRLGRFAAAEMAYRRSLILEPDAVGCLSNLGSVLREEGKLEQSAEVYAHAVSEAPDNLSTLVNAGHALRDLGRPADALALFDKVLAADPGYSEALRDRAEALLQMGDYGRGLPAYAALQPALAQPRLPQWDGSTLAGKTILVQDDGNVEDTLQFARFVRDLATLGAKKIIVSCRKELIRLFDLMPDIDEVIDRDVCQARTDCAISLVTLAHLRAPDCQALTTSRPYLRAPAPSLPFPQGDQPKVGLVWATTAARRGFSISLSLLLPLLDDPALTILGLQQGPPATELVASGADALIQDMGPRLVDFAEAAAVLTKLDLLVTVDCPLAHLAGALGVRTLVLLPYSAGWRWMDNREDSPWYPSLRLVRQDRPGQWERVLNDVAAELSVWSNKKGDRVKAPTKGTKISNATRASKHQVRLGA